MSSTPGKFIRPLVQQLHPYVPGEQPKISGLIKLNTNENPYPPSARVLEAIKAATDARLRLYPNPTSQLLREKLAAFHKVAPENIFVSNGSDEALALAVRVFVEPVETATNPSRGTVQYFTPSYSLYPVLAEIHGARQNPVPLAEEFQLPTVKELRNGGGWDFDAALTLVTTPNAPTGTGYEVEALATLCKAQRGIVLLDEAYVDFARQNALELATRYSNVLVARTFSKAYSLCFLRVGYCVGHPDLIQALDKIRDSYNVNGLGQVAALTTLSDLKYYRTNFKRIISTRHHVTQELRGLGFEVFPSETNFILVRPPLAPAKEWLLQLREKKLLVRWFGHSGMEDYLRITIGSEEEMEIFLDRTKSILKGFQQAT
ncbi:MAG: histidinol-phosphate transaminase [Verrucomicrobiota bacterium]|nr:histidinol-phosphate transaminase [Verrucomicrobiota bacterium]